MHFYYSTVWTSKFFYISISVYLFISNTYVAKAHKWTSTHTNTHAHTKHTHKLLALLYEHTIHTQKLTHTTNTHKKTHTHTAVCWKECSKFVPYPCTTITAKNTINNKRSKSQKASSGFHTSIHGAVITQLNCHVIKTKHLQLTGSFLHFAVNYVLSSSEYTKGPQQQKYCCQGWGTVRCALDNVAAICCVLFVSYLLWEFENRIPPLKGQSCPKVWATSVTVGYARDSLSIYTVDHPESES